MIETDLRCDANIRRGQLKHSWLDHKVRDKSADDVAKFWRDGSWANEIAKIFPYRINQARDLASGLANGFSPAQLVDRLGPLQNLPEESRDKLKKAVHAAYLEKTEILSLAESLHREVENFAGKFEKFRVLWNQEHTRENEMALREAWQQLQKSGDALLAVFETLPKGVVLP